MDASAPLHPSKIGKGVTLPATRQKSCNACVRGKRRCDKKAPKCTRCSSKGLECVYARVPPGASADAVLLEADLDFDFNAHNGAGDLTSGLEGGGVGGGGADVSDFCDMGGFVDMPSLADSSSTNTNNTTSPETESIDMGNDAATRSNAGDFGMRASDFDTMQMEPDMSAFSIADLLAQGNPAMDALWNMNDFHQPPEQANNKMHIPMPPPPQLQPQHSQRSQQPLATPALSTPSTEEIQRSAPIRDLTLLNDDCVSVLDPLEVYDPRTRPGFIIQFFSQMHITFSQTRALPFLHSRLYSSSLPKPIMAAFCATSAYANRTPETKGWTMKLVADAVKEVYSLGDAATTPTEKVARLQALLVLNIIRTLDGDIALRAASEREWHIMRAWTTDLINVRDSIEGEIPKAHWASREHPPESWESWLLLENMRRSVMVSISLICLVSILKGESNPADMLFREQVHYTASRHLWEADSSMAFFRAWRDKPKFLIHQLKFHEFWQYATADDLDEFTKVMLTTQAGVDGMEYFLSGEAGPMPANPCAA